MADRDCGVCGKPATVIVRIDYADGPHRYPCCDECSEDIAPYVEDVQILDEVTG